MPVSVEKFWVFANCAPCWAYKANRAGALEWTLLAIARIDVGHEGRADHANLCPIGDRPIGDIDRRLGRRERWPLPTADDHRDHRADQRDGRQQDHVAVLFPQPHGRQNRRKPGWFRRSSGNAHGPRAGKANAAAHAAALSSFSAERASTWPLHSAANARSRSTVTVSMMAFASRSARSA